MWLATIVCFCCTVHRVVLYLYVYHAFVRIRQNHMDSLHLVVCDFPCIFQPLSPRNGSFWGRGVEESFIVISDYEINPSVLRTPPLYFAAQNTGEESTFLFSEYREEGDSFSFIVWHFHVASRNYPTFFPAVSRNITGHGKGGG